MDAEAVSKLPAAQQIIIDARPFWAFAFFGLAVFSGALGSLFLLLRKSIAYHLILVSLVAVILQAIPSFGIDTDLSFAFILSMVLLQVGISSISIWYAKYSRNNGWLV